MKHPLPFTHVVKSCFAVVLFALIAAFPAGAGVWTNNVSGNWTEVTNWSPNVIPNGTDAIAIFPLDVTTARVITMDGPKTVGAIYLDDTNANNNVNNLTWTIRASNPATSLLTFQASGGQVPIISVSNVIATATSITMVDNPVQATLAGTNGLRKIGPGRWHITNAVYTGTTFIDEGALRLITSPFGFGFSTVRVKSGAQAYLSFGTGTITNDFFVEGSGVAEATPSWFFGGIRVANATTTLRGKITLTGNTRISTRGGTGVFAGQITEANGPNSLELNFVADSTTGTAILSNNTANANNWSGDTSIANGVVTRLANDEQIPNGAGKGNLIITNSWTLTANAGSFSIFDLGGRTETVNGLFSAGPDVTRCIITNNTGTGNLIVGDNNASSTFGGIMRGAFNLSKIGSGTLTLRGTVTNSGNTTITGGAVALGGSTIVSNTSALNMTNGALTLLVGSSRTNIYVGSVNLGGTTNLVNIAGVVGVSTYPVAFTLVKYTGAFNGNNIGIGATPTVLTGGTITNDAADKILVLTLTNGPRPITWKGNDPTNPTFWDVATTPNWDSSGNAAAFTNSDTTLINDTAAQTNRLNLIGTVQPAAIVVSNSVNDFTFTGAGAFGGGISGLTKLGAATLTMLEAGPDTFDGGVTVSNGAVVIGNDNAITGGVIVGPNGTLQVGTNGGTGTIPSGVVLNDGSLVFNRGADLTVSASIFGNGSLLKTNAGILTLSSANNFTGAVVIAGGTVMIGNPSSLGTTNGATIISNGGTLDVNGQNINQEPVVASGAGVGGNGAIVNSGAAVFPSVARLTLAGDTVIGGINRWDLRSPTPTDPSGASLDGAFSVTKVGTNFIGFSGVSVSSSVKNINIQRGTLSIETGTTGLGDPNATNTVSAGGALELWNLSSQLDKYFVLNGSGTNSTLIGGSGNQTGNNQVRPVSGGTIALSGDVIFETANNTYLTVNGTIGGTANLIKRGAGTNFIGGSISYAGSTTISNGVVYMTGTKNNGTGITVTSGGMLGGTATLNESVTASGQLSPGDPLNTLASALTINGDLTLNNNTNTFFITPGNGNSGMLDQINNLTVNGTAAIQIRVLTGQPLQAGQINTLFRVSGNSVGTNSFVLLPLQGYTFELLTNADTKSIDLHVLTAVGDLLWDGKTANGGVWNTLGAQSWLKNGTNTVFNPGDFVTFDDGGPNTITNVNISGDVGPAPEGLVTFNNNFKTYWLTGVGSITGATGMKIGDPQSVPASVVILNSNTFSGPVVLANGSLTLGAGGGNGSIGSAGIIATNPFALFPSPVVFNRSDSNLVINGNITGAAGLTNLGTGMVTLGGVNTFTGGVTVANGTLRIDNSASLGAVSNNLTVVNSGASLDIGGLTNVANGINAGGRAVVVSGAGFGGKGAIVNSNTNSQQNALQQVYLAGDTTFGGGNGNSTWTNSGNPGRWDIRGTLTSTNAFLSSSNLPFKLTKVGSNQVVFVGVHFDTNIGDIDIQAGELGFENGTISMGNPNSNLTVRAGGTLEFFNSSSNPNEFTKQFALNGDGITPTINVLRGPSKLNGAMTLNGACLFDVIDTAGNQNSSFLTNACALGGTGSLTLRSPTNAGMLVLSGTVNYSGRTTVASGILSLAGSASLANSPVIDLAAANSFLDVTGVGGSIARGAGQAIQGDGTVWGSLTLNSGATNSPGESVGVLTVTNSVVLVGGSTTLMEIDAGLGTNDQLIAGTTLQYGGSLIITTNGNGNLSGGQTFKLFAFGSAPTGTFTSVSLPNISPLSWNTNLLAGTVSVVAAGVTSPTNSAGILSSRLIGTNLVVHGTNNNIPNTAFHYAVMTSTNILTPLSNWTSVVTNAFDAGGTFDYTNPVTPGSSSRLFIDTRAVP